MAVSRIADLRRQELINAAYQVIRREGLRFTTLAKIEKASGASRGIIHHYFKDRQQLLEMAVRQVHASRSKELVQKLKAARTPSERLWTVVSMSLGHKYLEPGFCKAWNSLSAEAPSNKAFARLLRIVHAREKTNLIHALRQLDHRGDVIATTLTIQTLLEGIRRRVRFLTPPYSPRTARDEVLAFLKRSVPNFDPSAAAQQ
jgi:TetR/AcrR family transcriptional repressor of bet genes